jgi:16S rRNA (cytidine1402-2'-O)-methyltransferase
VVLVIGPSERGDADEAAGLDALLRLVDAGARARPAAGVVAELTGSSANALYRAYTRARSEDESA